MSAKHNKKAFTLIEVTIASVIVIIAVLGMSMFNYAASLGIRKADLRISAVRTGLLFSETWRGQGGTETFEPVVKFGPELNIQTSAQGPQTPTGFTALGNYQIVVNNTNCFATLSWNDALAGLRTLNVVIAWNHHESGSGSYNDVDRFFKLTTYVENQG